MVESADGASIESVRLEIYKEGNASARAIFDSFYKLAGLVFAYNAFMVTLCSFLLFNADSISRFSVLLLSVFVAFFGSIFNFGAALVFRASMRSLKSLSQDLYEFEKAESARFAPQSSFIGPRAKTTMPVERETALFLIAWAIWWIAMGVIIAYST